MFTAQDRALETALHSAHVVTIDGSTSTDPRDYTPVIKDGMVHMIERTPDTINIEIALTLNGRTHTVHFERDPQRNVHLSGLQSSGIAGLWLTALDLFGLRFVCTRAREAAAELNAWLLDEGKTSDAATFISVIDMHLAGLATMAAHAFEEKHNPFPVLALAA